MAIWLDGAAGAGKTTLTKALLEHIPTAKHFDTDEFKFELQPDVANTSKFLNIAQFQFCQSLKPHLDGGIAIVEYTLFDHLRALEIMHHLLSYQIYLIEVFCPLDELKRSEAARSGKRPGQTHLQYFLTAGRWISDLTLDSSQLQTQEMASQIIQHIQTQDPIGAFALNLSRLHELLQS